MTEPVASLQRCKQVLRGGAPCPFVASHRYTWPGKDESFICIECLPKLEATSRALDLHLQIIPLHQGA
jgi:hypothetical protein